ncbi:MAG: hypothetical protein EBV02_06700, partial [Actinobacteria bacterium]|nr:hypothetical protein [Actinomycetota bacterium]
DAQRLADAGVARVVMGSAAVRDPQLVDVVAKVIDVAVGLDHRTIVALASGGIEVDDVNPLCAFVNK